MPQKQALNLNWTEVDSSNVAMVGHVPDKDILLVQFKNGGLYSYKDADNELFVSLVHAESVGKYLNQHVKAMGLSYMRWDNEAELIEHINSL